MKEKAPMMLTDNFTRFELPPRGTRKVPLVLLGLTEQTAPEPLATRLRQEGMAVMFAHGERACLRVATAVSPDIILLDPRLPRALLSLLRAHPCSRNAQVSWSAALVAANARASV